MVAKKGSKEWKAKVSKSQKKAWKKRKTVKALFDKPKAYEEVPVPNAWVCVDKEATGSNPFNSNEFLNMNGKKEQLTASRKVSIDGFNTAIKQRDDARFKLERIKDIIDLVENRCLAADGPVTNTRYEMTDAELQSIYTLAGGIIHG